MDQLKATNNGVWKRARPTASKNGGLRTVIAADGSVKTLVDSHYLDYAYERYTNATLWIKDSFSPVVIRSEAQTRIAIMPIHPELTSKPGTGIRAITVTNLSR